MLKILIRNTKLKITLVKSLPRLREANESRQWCLCESSSYHKDVFKATRMAKQRFRIQSTLIPPFPPPCYSAYAMAFSWVSRSFTGKVKTTRPQDEVSLLMPISPNGFFGYFILTNGRDILFRVLVRSVLHDDVIKWKHFPRYWLFVRGNRWIPLTKASEAELWRFVWSVLE